MVTPSQLAAAHAVRAALVVAENHHPNSLALHRLHYKLAALRDSFQEEMNPSDFVTFGGGTNKNEEDE